MLNGSGHVAMRPAASIIIPLLRQRDEWLGQCVESAVKQSVCCDVIVVRAAATPRSNVDLLAETAGRWTNLRVLIETQPGSFPGAINVGIRAAKSDRVGLLLSDDWLDVDCVATCLRHSADIVCTGQATYFEDGVTLNEAACQTPSNRAYSALAGLEAKASYLEHFFLFSKKALLSVGGLDESIGNFPGIDDYDLIWTLLEHGATVEIVEERLYNYRDHDGERLTRANSEEAVRNLKKILRKHQVDEMEMGKVVEAHRRWFGNAIYRVLAESKAE
jgi:glycosyltransferase involved in cell wall biosynthesis